MRFYQVLGLVVVVVALSEGADVQPKCGRVTKQAGIWPWFAQIYLSENLLMSGSLISDQWVLTTAFFFPLHPFSRMTVVLGRTNYTGSNPKEVSRTISQAVCHPQFTTQTFDSDICLVRLSSPVELSDHISPVCLAAANSIFPNGTFSWIVGSLAGVNKNLAELQLQILGNNECQNHSQIPITANKICTRYSPSVEEPCLSAFGAPLLICNDDLVWIQLGISIMSEVCKKGGDVPVYTRVSSYHEWIFNITNSRQVGFITFPSSGDDGASTYSPPRTSTTPSVLPPRTKTTPPVRPPRTKTTPPVRPPRTKTTPPVRPPRTKTTPPVRPPRTTNDKCIFGSGEKPSSTFFTSVFVLLFSVIILFVWS